MSKTDDQKELQARLRAKPAGVNVGLGRAVVRDSPVDPSDPDSEKKSDPTYVQWSVLGNGRFSPVGKCVNALIPGIYDIRQDPNIGIYFEAVECDVEGILKFPDSVTDEVLSDIGKFWDREKLFRQYKTAYKRGVLLWGPPGSGKTCTIRLLVKDIIERDGIVLKYCRPSLFAAGLKIARAIQPSTPIIVLMEDIDAIIESHNESEIINQLDGVDVMDKIAFVATTNYPEKLGDRIINRPSRFDKVHKIGTPSAEARKMYFEYIFSHGEMDIKADIDKWVNDTDDMSIAHLKELFIGTCLLGEDYETVLERLRSMAKENNTSANNYNGQKAGFALSFDKAE